MLKFRSAALSDLGLVRQENEDRFIHDEVAGWFGVADGVGGLPAGAEAAERAVERLIAALRAAGTAGEVDLPAWFRAVNREVRELGRQLSPETGIGTTLTTGLVRNDVLHLGHVGDSRAYLSRGGELRHLTEDHSVENEARRRRAQGQILPYRESQRNALTRCIGQPDDPEVDVIAQPLSAGDRVLFCTDGVTRLVLERELGGMLAAARSPQDAVESLVQLAVRRGGPDNATAVALFVEA